MTRDAEKLKSALDELSVEDRAQLASYLIRSLDENDTTRMTDDELHDELKKRSVDIESGRDRGRPADEVMRDIREKYLQE